MVKRSDHPQFDEVREFSAPLEALGDPRRLLFYLKLVRYGSPVAHQTIREDLQMSKVDLSRMLHRLKDANLVSLATGPDRSVTVTVNTDTLGRIIRTLSNAYTALVTPKNTTSSHSSSSEGV